MLGPAGWEQLFGREEEVREIRTKMCQGEKWIWTGIELVALVCFGVFYIVLSANNDSVGGRDPAWVCVYVQAAERTSSKLISKPQEIMSLC